MLRKKPLIIFAVIGAALSGALIRMAFTAFESTLTNPKKATWDYFCASFGDDNPLPYRIVIKQGNEGEELKAEGFDNGEVLEALNCLSPRLATEEEIKAATQVPESGYERDLRFSICDRSKPEEYKEFTLSIDDSNVAKIEWIDERYWNSLWRNYYWLETEEIKNIVDVTLKVAGYAVFEEEYTPQSGATARKQVARKRMLATSDGEGNK